MADPNDVYLRPDAGDGQFDVRLRPDAADAAGGAAEIIGAGQMGTGIAHVIALGGYSVALNDLKKTAVEDAVAAIERNMGRQAS